MGENIDFVLKKIPSESVEVELPSIEKILLMPMFQLADIDFFRKNGTDFHRWLLDKVKFKHKNNYYLISSYVQYLYPIVKPTIQRMDGKFKNGEWHYDSTGSPLEENDVNHLLISESTSRTQFIKNDITININRDIDNMEFRKYINENEIELGIEPECVEPNKIFTFTNHIHRSISSEHPEFRYFFRVSETNSNKRMNNTILKESKVFIGKEAFPNIENDGKTINIHLYRGEN